MMRNIIILCIAGLLALPALAQQREAKNVLDKTSANFRKTSGIEAAFIVKIEAKGQPDGGASGNIQLKGDRFVLKTADAITWFDGKTQWSYLTDSKEVNISNPTEEELQAINPYALLSIYQKGFACAMGKARTFRGRSICEVVLTAMDKTKEMSKLTLYVTRDTYQPIYILAELNNGSRSEITITNYRTGQKFDDSTFVFDKKQYPDVEIIDLR